jgi:hypothetical protein
VFSLPEVRLPAARKEKKTAGGKAGGKSGRMGRIVRMEAGEGAATKETKGRARLRPRRKARGKWVGGGKEGGRRGSHKVHRENKECGKRGVKGGKRVGGAQKDKKRGKRWGGGRRGAGGESKKCASGEKGAKKGKKWGEA